MSGRPSDHPRSIAYSKIAAGSSGTACVGALSAGAISAAPPPSRSPPRATTRCHERDDAAKGLLGDGVHRVLAAVLHLLRPRKDDERGLGDPTAPPCRLPHFPAP